MWVFQDLSGVGAAAPSGPERQAIFLLPASACAVARVFNHRVIVLIFCLYRSRRDAIDDRAQERAASTLNPLMTSALLSLCI